MAGAAELRSSGERGLLLHNGANLASCTSVNPLHMRCLPPQVRRLGCWVGAAASG